jgi:hypothetical protein
MPVDLQVIAVQDSLPVLFLDYVPGLAIPTLNLRGRDFRSVREVYINGVLSPSFTVLSDSTMLAQIPNSEVQREIRTVNVLSNRFTATARSLIRFRLTRNSRGVTGIERLVQKFIRTAFTTPGSNIFDVSDGGGLQGLVGAAGSKYARTDLTGRFANGIDRTRTQIISKQDDSLPPDEKLAAADLVGVDFDYAEGRVAGRVKLTSVAGQSALVNVFPGQDDS